MSIPSISVSVHRRYTPEFRDKVLEKLRATMERVEGTAYRLLTPPRPGGDPTARAQCAPAKTPPPAAAWCHAPPNFVN